MLARGSVAAGRTRRAGAQQAGRGGTRRWLEANRTGGAARARATVLLTT